MKTIFSFILIIVITGWSLIDLPKIKKAEWLLGTWENNTNRGTIFESWEKVSDTSFSGKSYIIKENDTLVFETISLIEKNDNLFYIPAVKNQNQGLPVTFELTNQTETEMIFENPYHDFPQVISYTKISHGSLLAVISGTKNGQFRKQNFPMKKVN